VVGIVSSRLQDRLGALAERNFRILFTSTTVSGVGDAVANIALVFAVLQISSSPIALGAVLAGRQVAQAGITLAAGVWSDRLPRHLVLVAAATVQGAAQAVTGILVLTGDATVPTIVGLQIAFGLADGFVIPASQGLIPHTISAGRVQQANALLGLTRSTVGVIGPAVGGVLVALGSPGSALLVDAASFAIAAILLVRLRIPARAETIIRERFFAELHAGWREFRRQTWIWTTIVFFGISNCAFMSYFVLGPVVAKRDLGGVAAWATMSTGFGIGAIVGGLVALRLRPSRPLLTSCVAAAPIILQPLGIGLTLPVPVLTLFSFAGGIGIAVHLAFWFTVFQQQVPEAARSRVSSYDALGSFVLMPLGSAVAGPVAAAIGISTTLYVATAIMLVCFVIVVLQPSVRAIRAADLALAPAPASA
jgi:MFS family permease